MSADQTIYVAQMSRRADGGDDINLVGPFNSLDDAADYGATHFAPGGPDDPRWETVIGPVIRHVAPLATWDKGAYRKWTSDK